MTSAQPPALIAPTASDAPVSTTVSATQSQPTATTTPAPSLTPTASPSPQPTVTPYLLQVAVSLSAENVHSLVHLETLRFRPEDLVMALAWSPTGDALAISAGERIEIYNTMTWQPVAAFYIGAFSHSLAFSPDGAWLAAGSRDGYLRAWFVHPLLQQGIQPTGPDLEILAHKKGVNSVAFSPAGNLLASGGNDAVARFWDITTGRMLGQVVGGTFAVPSIDFLPGGNILAVVNGAFLRLREVDSERIVGSFRARDPLYDVCVHQDGQLLAASDHNNGVLLWQIEQAYRTGQEKYPDPVLLVAHAGKPGTYQALIWQVVFDPAGNLLLSAGGDATIRIWDVQKGTLLTTLAGHSRAVTSLAFHPEGRLFASGGLDGIVQIWGIIP